jgi:hypothetical protein
MKRVNPDFSTPLSRPAAQQYRTIPVQRILTGWINKH